MFEQSIAAVTPETATATDPRILAVAELFNDTPEGTLASAIEAWQVAGPTVLGVASFDAMLTVGAENAAMIKAIRESAEDVRYMIV